MFNFALRSSLTAVAFAAAVSTSAVAGPLPLFPFEPLPAPQHAPRPAAYAPVQAPVEAQEQAQDEVPVVATQSRFKRQVVEYRTSEAPGTVVVDTANTYLYFVLGGGKAIRYGIGVGRDGFTWSGTKIVERKAKWPDWRPPQEMLERQPYLPRFMAGGPDNPLGARAMYLSGSVYRIHGTNAPSTIGQRVSSGCFRLRNEDVKDLYERVKVGAKVVVLPLNDRRISNRSGFSTN
ncbi:MAG: L,D-transpeptidase [Xanthobacteraceae bacterium]|nr:L,D-transpeptidase [Xanthobacteraceae bacterium]